MSDNAVESAHRQLWQAVTVKHNVIVCAADGITGDWVCPKNNAVA